MRRGVGSQMISLGWCSFYPLAAPGWRGLFLKSVSWPLADLVSICIATLPAQILGPTEDQPQDVIFGPTEDQPLDVAAAATALTALQQQVNKHGTANASAANPYTAKSVDEVASGFITVANEAMCRPIRALTQMRGTDPDADVTFLRSCDMVPSKRVFDFYTVGRP
eukprot:scaffold6635_cov17-Tisochrysis_lutea.AAC.2